jgi:serine/threonine protein kinase/Leucine-rich repeat (LRR) protein
MTAGPEEFFKRLEDSGLLNDSIVEQMTRLRNAESAEAASAELVKQKLLTTFQGEVLVKGEQIPLVVGEYVVTDSIGRGGMGYVLKARHRRMKRQVAIKFLLKSLTGSEDLRRRFEREVEAAAQLDHQNIVTAYDAGVHDGSHYLVMQYVDGDDLSQLVKSSGPLDVPDAVDVIRQAALGLGYAHDRGIIHRDIKPGNLLLDNDGVVRILDMGLARMLPSPGDALEGGAQADLTNTGSVMGTIDYMAPEQALDSKSVDHRTDIYALGCTLYFLLTGNPPFRNDTVMRRLLAHREQPAPRISEFRPEAPRELDQIFAMMMAKSPNDRFPSMKHLVVALNSLDLDNSESEQMATLDMPDNENGGFIRLPENAENDPVSDQTFVTPERSSPDQFSTGSASGEFPAQDATIAESSSLTSAMEADSRSSIATLETGVTEVSETMPDGFVTRASTSTGTPLPWKLIVSTGLAILALTAILMALPDGTSSSPEPGAPGSGTTAQIDDTSSDPSSAQDHSTEVIDRDRRAAEWVLSVSGTVRITDIPAGNRSWLTINKQDGLPQAPFQLVSVDLSNTQATNDGMKHLRGIDTLKNLTIDNTPISDDGIATLTDHGRIPLPGLGLLQATETQLANQSIRFLAGSTKLTVLILQQTQVDDIDLIVNTFPALVLIDIGHTNVLGSDISKLGKLRNLFRVAVNGRPLLESGSDFLSRLPNLRELTIYEADEGFDAEGLRGLSELEQLHVIDAQENQLTDAFWSEVNSLPKLDRLKLIGAGVTTAVITACPPLKGLTQLELVYTNASCRSVAEVARRIPGLQMLRLSHSGVTDEDISDLANLPRLEFLSVKDSKLSLPAIQSLQKALPATRIESDFGTFDPVDPSAMSTDRRAAERVLALGGQINIHRESNGSLEFVSELPLESFQLVTVQVSSTGVTDDDLKYLQGLTSLTSLSMWDTEITDRGLANLTDSGRVPLPSLDSIYAQRLNISDKGIACLAGCSGVFRLYLSETQVSDLELVCRTFPNLSQFHIERTSLAGESLAQLKALSHLQELTISGDQLRNGGSRHLAELVGLKRLIVVDASKGFEADALTNLSGLGYLELRGVTDVPLSEKFWSTVSALPRLAEIGFDGWGVSSGFIEQIPAMSQLRSLTIGHSTADGAAIANAAKRLPQLETLNLNYNDRLDAAGLTHLATLTSIKRLILPGTPKLTAANIESLHTALPNCRIESDFGTFEPASDK